MVFCHENPFQSYLQALRAWDSSFPEIWLGSQLASVWAAPLMAAFLEQTLALLDQVRHARNRQGSFTVLPELSPLFDA